MLAIVCCLNVRTGEQSVKCDHLLSVLALVVMSSFYRANSLGIGCTTPYCTFAAQVGGTSPRVIVPRTF